MKRNLLNQLDKAVSVNRQLFLILKKLLPGKLRAKIRQLQGHSDLTEEPYFVLKINPNQVLIPGVNLVGYSRSEMGVGEACRIMAKCLEHSGYPYSVYPLTVGDPNRKEDRSLLDKESAEFKYKINLFSLNAEQLPLAAKVLSQAFDKRYNIGYWFWELPELPESHLPAFNYLNEIWAPSRFVFEAIKKKSPLPVYSMPLAVTVDVPPNSSRQDFNLPQDKFLYLCMFDLHSAAERKNAGAAIRAFQKAFSLSDEKVGLVVKINNATSTAAEITQLQKTIGAYKNIYIINRIFTRQQVNGLLNNIDAVISLHRSEGFGLVMAEAMYLGKVAIATAWSGNIDFMNEQNSCLVNYKLIKLDRDYGPYEKNQVWAAPDEEHAAFLMKKVFANPDFYHKLSVNGMKTIKTEYSPEAVGSMLGERIKAIESRL